MNWIINFITQTFSWLFLGESSKDISKEEVAKERLDEKIDEEIDNAFERDDVGDTD